jgi:hypothetical protein
MDCDITKIDVLLFEGGERIVTNSIQDEFLPSFLRAEVLGVAHLLLFMLHNKLLVLCSAYPCNESHVCICARICLCHVCPCRIRDHDAAFGLMDDARKAPKALAFVKVVQLQDCEGPAKFVHKVVDSFGCDDACDCTTSISCAPISDNFDDILPLTLLVRVDV